MKIIILLSSIALVSASKKDPPPRSVNVALETSFLFDPKDINDNKSFVNNIKGFLDKLYKMLEPAKKKHNRAESETQETESHNRAESNPQETGGGSDFIEILRTIGSHFVNMPGEKVKEAVNTIHSEVSKVADNRKSIPTIKEILPEDNIKLIIKDSITEWLKSNPEEMKKIINTTITDDSPLLKTFARRMNSYYNYDDVKKLNKILKKFKKNIENNIDNSKVIKEILNNAIFKKYNSLNESAKTALLSDMKVLSGFLVAKNMLTGLNENLSITSRRNSPTIEKDDTANFHENDMTYTAIRRSIDKQIRDARDKKDEKKKGSEIVLDNVEVFLEPPKNI